MQASVRATFLESSPAGLPEMADGSLAARAHETLVRSKIPLTVPAAQCELSDAAAAAAKISPEAYFGVRQREEQEMASAKKRKSKAEENAWLWGSDDDSN
jgi:hypothetical protein